MNITNRNFIAALLLAIPLLSRAQNINTIAGNFSFGAGYSGDGGQATSAELYDPTSVVFNKAGDKIIADYQNNRIRSVNHTTGIITTIAGNGVQSFNGDGGQATAAELYWPSAVGIDSSGNIYIFDAFNYRIRKVDAITQNISTIAGTGTGGAGGDNGLATAAQVNGYGLVVDKAGDIFIADYYDHRIREIASTTSMINTVAGTGTAGSGGDGGQATAAGLNHPIGVGLDAAGNIYIADYGNQKIREVTVSSGIINTIAGNGTQSYSGDGGQATDAELYNPTDIAVDASSNVYICDQGNNRIREINFSTGIINTIAGNGTQAFSGDGGPATAAEMNHPYGVSLDANTNIYIADEFNNVIREIGSISTGLAKTLNTQLFSLYPNPSNGKFTIQLSVVSNQLSVEIYNVTGEKVFSQLAIDNSQLAIDLSSQPNGIYFVRVQSNGRVHTEKFIKY